MAPIPATRVIAAQTEMHTYNHLAKTFSLHAQAIPPLSLNWESRFNIVARRVLSCLPR